MFGIGKLGRVGGVRTTLATLLSKYGTNAHAYLPGIGTVSGLTAGNYLDSAGTTAATVDNPVGLVVDSLGAVNATQATTASKPILRRGLVNLAIWSRDYSNAAWVGPGWSKTAGAADPDGGTSAFTITANSNNADPYQAIAGGMPAGSPFTSAIYIRRRTGSGAIRLGIDGTNFTDITASVGTSWSALPSVVVGTSITADVYMDLQIAVAGDKVDVWTSGLFKGSYTAQQIIAQGGIPVTTTAAASNPLAGSYSWSFDGSNDSLLTGNLGITNTVTVVIAGVLNTLPATTVLATEGVNGLQILIRNTGVIDCLKAGVEPIISAASGTIVAGVPFVLTFRLQGGVSVLRKNGAQVSTAAYVASLSATAGLSIGDASSSINGSIYSIDVITATTTDADCLAIEKMVGQIAGVAIA